MLCSVPTGGKSSSNWLDRLRSNKGFPVTENLDLDHFLTNHQNSLSDSPVTDLSNSVINPHFESTQSDNKQLAADRSQAAETSSESTDRQWFGVMTNVLCDLFNMGDPKEKISRFSRKKSTRKQTNPKFCDVSAPTTANAIESIGKEEYVQATTASLHSDNNSNVGINADCGDDDVDDEKEKGGGGGGGASDRELKGYSRSEVTVIDTSFEVWKFDKLVFRRKNIWKVRDKKGKSWTSGSKKRKGNQLESGNGNVVLKKKAKISNLEFGSSKDSNGEDFMLPSNDKPQDGRREEISKETSDDYFQVPKKRSPRKTKKIGSSVILVKAIPTSKKYGKNLPKDHLKDTQRQCKA
ncbi:hypothetical protein JCGZ_17073 [Jatropha curcas]|uniref:Uncharacterized protein n=1 Tax=Jatropha curcas TaxID=180498 RepID=A0A067LL95_JATCU|nr:uncharacterized protein LOC105641036 [Jatropha curcas]KDP45520.1 hypothetical protein JCGZ_17073 [Jatropha curcas]